MSLSDDSKTLEQKTTENKDLTFRIVEILRNKNYGFVKTQFLQSPNIEPKLNEKNYSIWARKVKIALGGRGRWHHITGVPEPLKINEPDYYIWEQNDLQVLSWIIDSMENDLIGQFIEYFGKEFMKLIVVAMTLYKFMILISKEIDCNKGSSRSKNIIKIAKVFGAKLIGVILMIWKRLIIS
ncbi:hypothetical protein CASFOL_004567 [Castilleja foliolosa]|uniref:Retrotransposon Copia-like N-terminal domain-containing protein n=1 Tax=Castilleja foliolosa TaxID=1961234 RepID=A0ABD3EEL1_9LAMI